MLTMVGGQITFPPQWSSSNYGTHITTGLSSVVILTQQELRAVPGERRESHGCIRKVVREGKRLEKVADGRSKKETSGDT